MGEWFEFRPVDSWMFRDGRPFDQNDMGAAEARSIFPPWPPTAIGAFRAAIWQGPLGSKWDKAVLGDGTDWQQTGTLGPLTFGPQILLRKGEPLYPAPLNLLRGKDGRLTLLRPGPALECDHGNAVRLPEPAEPLEGAKTLEEHFLSAAGMERRLAGGLPEAGDLVRPDDIFTREERVGIAIDPDTRRVRDGALYMASHVRPKAGVTLAMRCSGLAEGHAPAGLVALGGEHRAAEIRNLDDDVLLPRGPAPQDGRRLVVAITPVVLDHLPGPGEDLAGLGRVVSACLGRPVRIGGWDSQNRRALPLKIALPAGSVWFLEEAGEGKAPEAIGLASDWGFGAVLSGRWEG